MSLSRAAHLRAFLLPSNHSFPQGVRSLYLNLYPFSKDLGSCSSLSRLPEFLPALASCLFPGSMSLEADCVPGVYVLSTRESQELTVGGESRQGMGVRWTHEWEKKEACLWS